MEEIIGLIELLLKLPPEQKVFFVSVLSILVAGFSLFVVLAAVKRGGKK